jgi:hypothetical protein
VREASLRRRLPGTVVIEIAERVPCAIVRVDRPCLVDAEGAILDTAGTAAAGLPVFTGIEILAGELTAHGREDLAAGLALVAAIRQAGFPALAAIDHIDLADPDDAVIVPAAGRPLVHAGRGDASAQLARWRLVAPDMARRWPELEYVDLRVEGQIVALPAAPAPDEAAKPDAAQPPRATGAGKVTKSGAGRTPAAAGRSDA